MSNLAGSDNTTITKLQAIADAIGQPSGGLKVGYVGSIGTGADSQFGSQALSQGLVVKNISTAGQALYIGVATGPTATTSFVLYAGESTPQLPVTNANLLFIRSSAAGGAACYAGS